MGRQDTGSLTILISYYARQVLGCRESLSQGSRVGKLSLSVGKLAGPGVPGTCKEAGATRFSGTTGSGGRAEKRVRGEHQLVPWGRVLDFVGGRLAGGCG